MPNNNCNYCINMNKSLFYFYYALLSLLFRKCISSQSNGDYNEFVTIYSHCDPTPHSTIHENNGLYYVKPTADGSIIPVICSNGYTMIDISMDTSLQSYASYLSSYDYARGDADHLITNLDDTSTFREWWLPSTQNTKFRVAPNCQECITDDSTNENNYGDNVVYYTDGIGFCYTIYDGYGCPDMLNEYACNVCDVGEFDDDNIYWHFCSALRMSADAPSWHEDQMRVGHHLIYRPVLSLIRDACTCFQEFDDRLPEQYIVKSSDLPLVTLNSKYDVTETVDFIDDIIKLDTAQNKKNSGDTSDNKDDNLDCDNNVHYLYQKDFLYGTYRIRECGEYRFMEDIVCNFNAPSEEDRQSDNFSPNQVDGDRLYWFPTPEQTQSDGDYPGLYTYTGSYSLGFFSGITVECSSVVINLNGFSFSMHSEFYLQQRFFSLIELASKYFLPLQGPSTWGVTDVHYAQNIEIHGPGKLYQTSHHGIHGNENIDVRVHDLTISKFDVAGFHCNGCQRVFLENLVVGPGNDDIPTLGRYTHSRAFIPRLKQLNDEYGHKEISFYGRPTQKVSDLVDRMVEQMDMMYFNYIDDTEYDDTDSEWIAAQKIFKNPNGWMDGGSSYGIVINGGGAAVVGLGSRHSGTANIYLKNIEIFGIYNSVIEKVKYSASTGTMRLILFDVLDWIAVTDDITDRKTAQYIGDVYTDIIFASHMFVGSWYYRNSLYVAQNEIEYVFNGNLEQNGYPFNSILPDVATDGGTIGGCGTDIQLHSSKGAIGLMVNGAMESVFDNIYIHDIYNWAEMGSDICGEYDGPRLTDEDPDIQYGYTGTRSHGMVIDYMTGSISNLQIENVQSKYGEANGLTIYKECDVTLSDILVNNIKAGTELSLEEVAELVLPNLTPRACPVDIRDLTIVKCGRGDSDDGSDRYCKKNIVYHDVEGFEVCDQYNTLNEGIDHESLIRNVVLLLSLLVSIPIMLYALTNAIKNQIKKASYVDITSPKFSGKNKNKCCVWNDKVITVSEKTPLLCNKQES